MQGSSEPVDGTGPLEPFTLLEAVPALVWSADAGGAVDWYSRSWYDYTGLRPHEAAGWGWQAAFHPNDLPALVQACTEAFATGAPLSINARMRRRDGTFRTFEIRAHPVRDRKGAIVRWVGTDFDIDDQQLTWQRASDVAERLQGLFLPEQLPSSSDRLHIDAAYVTGGADVAVGGDWIDVMALPDGRYLCSIGDVTGHGLDASLMAARMRYAIRDFAWVSRMPSEVLARVNEVARVEFPDTYATTLVGFVDADRSSFTYACAGHPPPILARTNEEAIVLSYGGLPLGVVDELRIASQVCDVREGDTLALYTDGFPDTFFGEGNGEARLARAVADVLHDGVEEQPAEEIRRRFFAGSTPGDDAALLLIRFQPPRSRGEASQTAPHKVWMFHSSDARAAHISRIELRDYLASRVVDANDLFASELILGELLANTVRHAPGLVHVVIDTSEPYPVVTVRDHGPGMLPKVAGHDEMSESGRGLEMIASLARALSYAPAPGGGTEFRVVLPVETAAPMPR